MRLTSAQFRALHYIGHCQGNEAKVGSILSRYLLDWLKDIGLATEYDGIILLTRAGEYEFEKLCPKRTNHFH